MNLPLVNLHLKQSENKEYVFDIVRKQWVMLTSEEWVRQHLVHYLISRKNYPASLMKIEKGLKQRTGKKRTDIVVYNNKAVPVMIIECKSVNVNLSQNTINQAANYNIDLKAPYLLVSNGMKHFIFFIDFANNKITQLKSIPDYKDL